MLPDPLAGAIHLGEGRRGDERGMKGRELGTEGKGRDLAPEKISGAVTALGWYTPGLQLCP